MLTLADVLKKSGWTQEQIDALDANARNGFNSVLSAADQAEQDALKKQAEATAAAAKSLEIAVDRIKDRIKTAMSILHTDEVHGSFVRFKLSNGAPKVIIDDERMVPAEYMAIKTTMTPDKVRIGTFLKDDQTIPGCHLEPTKTLRTYIAKG